MKTLTNRAVVTTLCTVSMLAALSGPAMAKPESGEQADRQPTVLAQQVYRYSYTPEAFQGSIAYDVELVQADIMADLQKQQPLDIADAIERSASELKNAGLIASAETLQRLFKLRAYL